ncbi:hypothetical protein HRI_001952700 [Hibiscus trionum]|uniref:Uncharacterized protein n=1 Tax=Hibiscus trionum TaxID=183268 RepID=A0A9W7LZN1_HIBTR|nr:hypothetical protein HRI_001952700 [Hibiscus trionum]
MGCIIEDDDGDNAVMEPPYNFSTVEEGVYRAGCPQTIQFRLPGNPKPPFHHVSFLLSLYLVSCCIG